MISRGSMTRLWAAVPAVATAVAASPALGQNLAQGANVNVSPWRVIAAFCLCIGLAIVAILALRSRMGVQGARAPHGLKELAARVNSVFARIPKTRRALHLQESLRVSPQLEICLLTFDNEQFLIAATPQSATVLHRRPATTLVPDVTA